MLVVFNGPLLVLGRNTRSFKRARLLEYSTLAGNHGHLIYERWIRNRDVGSPDILNAPELGPAADVATLYEAMHGGLTGAGTDEDAIMRVLRNKTAEEREAVIAEYKKRYGIDLNTDLKEELDDGWSSHHDYDRATALMEGNTAKADAIVGSLVTAMARPRPY